MMYKEAQEEFNYRYYCWAREEAHLEIANGFPFMRRIDNAYCRKHLRRMAQLSIEEQQAFTALLVKRGHEPRAVERAGDVPLSSEDIAKINRYFAEFPLELDPEDQAFLQRELQGDPTAKLDRKRFREIIKESLRPIFGKEDRWGGGGCWSYTTSIECLQVTTYIDTGGRYHQLSYDHRIMFAEIEPLHEGISVLHWLGFSSGTDWSQVEDSKAEETAHLLAELCDHFLKAAHGLLEGFAP
ncbi:MAG: hypothetical protein ABFD54_12140 [Armatimonadota bacterium]|nr:hypothetical protein [bacterium]